MQLKLKKDNLDKILAREYFNLMNRASMKMESAGFKSTGKASLIIKNRWSFILLHFKYDYQITNSAERLYKIEIQKELLFNLLYFTLLSSASLISSLGKSPSELFISAVFGASAAIVLYGSLKNYREKDKELRMGLSGIRPPDKPYLPEYIESKIISEYIRQEILGSIEREYLADIIVDSGEQKTSLKFLVPKEYINLKRLREVIVY